MTKSHLPRGGESQARREVRNDGRVTRNLETFKAETDPLHVLLTPQDVIRRDLKPDTKVYIITAAQNATPVHAGFWRALLSCAAHRKAEILVIPIRYKNPTSAWSGSQRNAEHWDAPVRPYLWNQRHALNANIVVAADVKTQPTATSPVSGFEGLTGGESTILAHTRLQLRVVPTPQNTFPKILTTTGACTVPNYTDSRAGKLGHFHHTLGAAIVEVDGKEFHLRQINADAKTGAFTDLGASYAAGGLPPMPAARPLAISLGDTHVRFRCPKVEYATFGPGGIIPTLKPQRIFWHDLADMYAVNPHECENPFVEMGKRLHDHHQAKPEMIESLDYVVKMTPADTESVIVFSNHNRFLARWIENTDWQTLKDRDNVLFYFETAARIAKSVKWGDVGVQYDDAFTSWARTLLPKKGFRVLDRDEAFMSGGVDWGSHGDDGPNGSRGSLKAYSKLGVKTNTGHDHTGGIEGGATRGGTSTRRYANYTHGPSSWMNTHVMQYASHKRTLINCIGKKWRGA